ncbi:MAG: Fur family transcriptional regulator [bacterium]
MMQDIQKFKSALHGYGLKLTPQRMAVFSVLSKTNEHPDADSIFTEVKKILPSVSLATVYSTLKSLKKIGIVYEVGSLCESKHFDGNVEPHLHLICLDCNKIEDVHGMGRKDLRHLRESVARATDYDIVRSCLSFYGYCQICAQKKTRKAAKGR